MYVDLHRANLNNMDPETRSLTEKLTVALALVSMRDANSGLTVSAFIWGKNTATGTADRVDFCTRPGGSIGQAFIGPDTPITSDLLGPGDSLSPEFLAKVQAAFDAFVKYWKES